METASYIQVVMADTAESIVGSQDSCYLVAANLSMRLEVGYQWDSITDCVEIFNAQLYISSAMARNVNDKNHSILKGYL